MDTGVQADHPEIQGRVAQGVTFDVDRWTSLPEPSPRDTQGHGTHVAGLICGRQVGVAPEATVVSGVMIPNGRGNLSDFVLALEWAANQPEVQIVNVSAGIPGYLDGMHAIVEELLLVGVLPVVAVGNEGRNQTRSPGNYTQVLSVGAVDRKKGVASFSGGGTIISPDRHQYSVPNLVGPGVDVYSCVMTGGYEAWDGTSMATPIVSGVAALLLERHAASDMTVLDLREELLEACEDLGQPIDRQGCGLIQVKPASTQGSLSTTEST